MPAKQLLFDEEALRRLKDDPRPQRHALLRLRRPDPLFQRAPVLFLNYEGGRCSAHTPSYYSSLSFESRYEPETS